MDPDNVDLIPLETSTNRIKLTPKPLLFHSHRPVYGVKSTSWCTGAYIISKKTAQKLIDLPTEYHDASDVLLYNFSMSVIAPSLNILQFNPAPCTQDKYLVTGNVKFSSNIEHAPNIVSRFKALLERFTPLAVARGIYRSLNGFKRIQYR